MHGITAPFDGKILLSENCVNVDSGKIDMSVNTAVLCSMCNGPKFATERSSPFANCNNNFRLLEMSNEVSEETCHFLLRERGYC